MLIPRLPPELERLIFINAFLNRSEAPVDLFLVARRVKEWLFPLAFGVVLVHGQRRYPIRFNTHAHFECYGIYIKHIYMASSGMSPGLSLDECLAHCPNISNLVLGWESPPIPLTTLTNLGHLTKMSVGARYLFNELRQSTTQIPVFPRITHLDMAGTHRFEDPGVYLLVLAKHFPALTHISFLCNTQIIDPVLRNFKRIRAVISWRLGALQLDERKAPPVDDDRVVMICFSKITDWEKGARGQGPGMSKFVDEVLEKRAREKSQRLAQLE